RRRIQGWANTGRHFLRIGFSITPILSNTYRVIRPICARSGLGDLAKGKFESPTHRVSFSVIEQGVDVVLSDATMDRDFVLEIHPQGVESIGLLASHDDQSVVALNFLPPAESSDADAKGRNFVMVLDCSGSMAGDSIDQAKEGIRLALTRLKPEDKFALIGFGSNYQCFHDFLLPANRKNINLAHEFVKNLPDMGGTEMMTALEAALGYSTIKDDGVSPPIDVLLLTDGEAWGVESMAKVARSGGHRIFTVGIGSAVAEDVVRTLADGTSGACELVTPNENMAERIERHFLRMRQPRISSIELDYGQAAVWETRPQRAVFAGDSITVFAALSGKPPASIKAVLRYANAQAREYSIALHEADTLGEALIRVGAQSQLLTLEPNARMAWAVRYQLVSDETDYLIMVVREADEKADASPELQVVPQMLAAGWGGSSSVRYSIGSRVSEVCMSPVGYLDVPAVLRCSTARQASFEMPLFRRAKVSRSNPIDELIKKLNKQAGSFILASLPKSLKELESLGMPADVMSIAFRLLGEGYTESEVVNAILHGLANHHCGKSLNKKFWALLAKEKRVVLSEELQATFKLAFDEYLMDEPHRNALPPERYDIPAFLKVQAD
ncbi:MAG: VWA domain-containing protein, partial [Rhodocyclaceae bacterium]|nr:VWA domain-containing protein [Rhodocyclaceae bacterium]